MKKYIFLLVLLCLYACKGTAHDPVTNDDDDSGPAYSFADMVVEAPDSDPATAFKDPQLAVNGVRGAGYPSGGTDVYSLTGITAPESNYLTLRWTGKVITDGPGTDFVVFENAFVMGSLTNIFMEQLVIWLSLDGTNWVQFPCDYSAPDETNYSRHPDHWQGFAGVQPVLYNVDSNPVDPFDQSLAGGDHFDLSLLPDDGGLAQLIKTNGFRYLKLQDHYTQVNPDSSTNYPAEPGSFDQGADIDGVCARYWRTDS